MDIHIYLPDDFHKFKYYYGQRRVESRKKVDVEAYYVTKCTNKLSSGAAGNLMLLGTAGRQDKLEAYFDIEFDENAKIERVRLRSESCRTAMIFNYKPSMFRNFDENDYSEESIEQYFFLHLASLLKAQETGRALQPTRLVYFALDLFARAATCVLGPFSQLFEKTAMHQHATIWRREFNERRMRNGSIIFDVLLGLFVCLLMMTYVRETEDYFMSVTEFILERLRVLLEQLDGSPVGLKLNVQLNNFLHRCFMYHVDLWWNFIVIVEPAIRYLFVPTTIFGVLGFSFQCAMLCDIITLISLHAHCFYIYAAMLYKLELTSLRSLWRVVIGRRLNVLKNRVESQKYSNRQLFLATLFFTTLLFLLPTILTYYFVFAALRMLIYCLTYVLVSLQRMVLKCPFYDCCALLVGRLSHPENLSIELMAHDSSENFELYHFQLTQYRSSPWSAGSKLMKVHEDCFKKPIPIDKFLKNLLRGDLMAFSNVQ